MNEPFRIEKLFKYAKGIDQSLEASDGQEGVE